MHGGKRRPQLGGDKRSAWATGTLGDLGDGGTDDSYNQKRPQHVAATAMTTATTATTATIGTRCEFGISDGWLAGLAGVTSAEGAHPEVRYTHQGN